MSRWTPAIALVLGGCAVAHVPMSVKNAPMAPHMGPAHSAASRLSSSWNLPYWSNIQVPAQGGLHPSLSRLSTPWYRGISPYIQPPSWWSANGQTPGGAWGMMPPTMTGLPRR